MPTIRRRIGRQPVRGEIPRGALWWLQNGRTIHPPEALKLGLDEAVGWQAFILQYDHQPVASSMFWSRQDLRAAGYGAQIDAHVQAGRCPPDDWRTPPTATVLPFRGDR